MDPLNPESAPGDDFLAYKPASELTRLERRARNIAIYRVAQRALTEQQVREALIKKEIPLEIVEPTIDWLRSEGYVNDAYYASERARGKMEKGLSERAIRTDLQRKGIDREFIDEALKDWDPIAEENAARELAQKKKPSLRGLPKQKQYARLSGFLSRKGYPFSIVSEVVASILLDLEEEQE